MKYNSLNWTLALKFSIGKKKRMRDCRILMAHDCIYNNIYNAIHDDIIHLGKITATQNEAALSYHRVRTARVISSGSYFFDDYIKNFPKL